MKGRIYHPHDVLQELQEPTFLVSVLRMFSKLRIEMLSLYGHLVSFPLGDRLQPHCKYILYNVLGNCHRPPAETEDATTPTQSCYS
jgi:hypothetical protein